MNFNVDLTCQELKMDGLNPFFLEEDNHMFYEPETGCQDTREITYKISMTEIEDILFERLDLTYRRKPKQLPAPK